MQPQSSTSTGPTCPSTTTCEPSRQHTHTHTHRISSSISSAEVSPAKTSALLAREQDLQARGPVFGTILLGSFAQFGHDGWSLKTSQLSLLEGSEPFSETWPKSGLMRSGTAYRLQPLVRRIDGNESGSSAFACGMTKKPTHHVPTPTASDHIERKSTSSEKLNFETNKSVSLDRWVGMWPTPKASAAGADFAKVQRSKTGISLATAVAMWPTPTAHGFDIADVPALLARRERCSEKNKNGNGFGLTLNQVVKVAMYPTPTVQDASNNAGPSQYDRNSLPLNAVAGGSLNPTWVEWLMGFPLGWTALDASATPSSRKSSKSSDGRSLQRKRG